MGASSSMDDPSPSSPAIPWPSPCCGTAVTPGRGGTLCLAGDCGNCLATVDGVAYVRTCQTPARPGLAVVSHPAGASAAAPRRAHDGRDRNAARPRDRGASEPRSMSRSSAAARAGLEAAATAERAGKSVLVLDAGARRRGRRRSTPARLIVVRTQAGMLHVHAEEIVVATGAAEIHPVCPGTGCGACSPPEPPSACRRRA